MKLSNLLLAAVLAPTLSLAQEPPPPAPPPAPPAAVAPANPVYPAVPVAAPAPAYQHRGPRRDPWYIGFGIGTGSGDVSGQGSTFSFKEMNLDRSTTNIALNFKIGATLSPRLLLGFDVTAAAAMASEGGVSTSIQVTNYDAMVTFFPMETGFFVRGGVGLTNMVWDLDVLGSNSYKGGNVLVGVGYAWWIGQKFNLTANLDFSAQSYGSSTDAPESSKFWALWLGFDWY